MMRLDFVEWVVVDIVVGKVVIVIDDEDWENEGDLIFVVEKVMLEMVVFMVCYIFGYLCVLLDGVICDWLGLLFMYVVN